MSTPRGIFESFPSQSSPRPESPFAVVPESAPASPFKAVARQESPFAVVEDAAGLAQRAAKIPDRRKAPESPFQIADPHEGFGFEAPAQAYSTSPFEAAPVPQAVPAPSPFSAVPSQAAAPTPSPFSVEAPPAQAFANWQTAPPQPSAHGSSLTPTQAAIAAFATPPAPIQQAPVFTPAPQPVAAAPTPVAAAAQGYSDSFSIRQLELRAIFGVDREMTVDEILQRSRSLPGIRTIARVGTEDIASVEALKNMLSNLGFGSGSLKLYTGSVPIEFIREGNVLLAVQTDGGFAPGVRETLMIVARELNRM